MQFKNKQITYNLQITTQGWHFVYKKGDFFNKKNSKFDICHEDYTVKYYLLLTKKITLRLIFSFHVSCFDQLYSTSI